MSYYDSGYVVNCWDKDVQRVTLKQLSRPELMQCIREGRLEFQLPGNKRKWPDHIPTLQELEEDDAYEKECEELRWWGKFDELFALRESYRKLKAARRR